jgi:transcriptional regulator with XRE-family HTH domain
MEKTIYTREYETVLRLLREARDQAGLTQIDLAERIGETQSFVSKVERGDRRLDIVELRQFCRAIGLSLAAFVERLEGVLGPDA